MHGSRDRVKVITWCCANMGQQIKKKIRSLAWSVRFLWASLILRNSAVFGNFRTNFMIRPGHVVYQSKSLSKLYIWAKFQSPSIIRSKIDFFLPRFFRGIFRKDDPPDLNQRFFSIIYRYKYTGKILWTYYFPFKSFYSSALAR
jgi:hypothetical protein